MKETLINAFSEAVVEVETRLKTTEQALSEMVPAIEALTQRFESMQRQLEALQRSNDAVLKHVALLQEQVLTLTKKTQENMPAPAVAEVPQEPAKVEKKLHINVVEDELATNVSAQLHPAENVAPSANVTPAAAQPTQTHLEANEIKKNTTAASVAPKYNMSLHSTEPVDDIQRAITLGDRFLFQRELFNQKIEAYQKTLEYLNTLNSFDEAMRYINNTFNWDKQSPAYEQFMLALKRRFPN